MSVGDTFLSEEPVEINAGRRTAKLVVTNTGDRPIQVGSHFHFFEVNRALRFDRRRALGTHLDVPAGSAVRFEPGDEKEVQLVEFGGTRRVIGFNGLVNGSLSSATARNRALLAARREGFLDAHHSGDRDAEVREAGGGA